MTAQNGFFLFIKFGMLEEQLLRYITEAAILELFGGMLLDV